MRGTFGFRFFCLSYFLFIYIFILSKLKYNPLQSSWLGYSALTRETRVQVPATEYMFLIVGLFSPWAYFEAYITFPSLGNKIQRKGFNGWAVFLGLTLRPVYRFHLGFLLGITLRPMYHFQTNYNPRVVLVFQIHQTIVCINAPDKS